MITIEIFQSGNKILGYEVKGHAGFARIGKDIVCSAVSTLTINTANSLEALTDHSFSTEMEDGYLKVYLKDSPSEQSELLFRSMVLGLEEIQKDKKKYLKVNFEEV